MPASSWRVLLVGRALGRVPSVAPGDIEQADPRTPVIVLAPGLGEDARRACLERWPSSWVAELRAVAPTMAPDLALAGLEPAGVAAIVFDAWGRLHGATRALRDRLGLDGPLDGTSPDSIVALRAGQAGRPAIDGSPRQAPLRAWWMGSDGAGCLVVALPPAQLPAGILPALLDHAREMVSVIDDRGVVRYQSPATRPILGLPAERFVGHRLPAAFAEDRRAVSTALEEVLRIPAGVRRVAWRARHADGTARWLESTLCNQRDNPAVGGVVANTRDITERRLLEDSRREQERLRAASLLASTVAHDLNNMLSVIALHLDVLAGAPGAGDETVHRLDAVQATISRASELARRLLAFGHEPDAGDRRIDLGELVRQLVPVIEPIVGRQQRLDVHIDDGSHPVRIDPARLEQAVVNLVVNARDAAGDRGRLSLRVERRPGGSCPAVAVVVEDDGPGMAPEVLDRVFDPHFSTKTAARGSGLGLVMVRMLAEDAGGRVEVHSAPGAGTRFEVLLPIDLDPARDTGRTIP